MRGVSKCVRSTARIWELPESHVSLTVSQVVADVSMTAMGTPIEALYESNAELMAQRRE